MSLTPLGTRAMRQRMLAEGRETGLVGELANAAPAELLGTVAGHYPPQPAAEEIAIWRAAHGSTLDPLLQAVRDCPFVSRQATMLNVPSVAVPERRGTAVWPAALPRTRPGHPAPVIAQLAELPRAQPPA